MAGACKESVSLAGPVGTRKVVRWVARTSRSRFLPRGKPRTSSWGLGPKSGTAGASLSLSATGAQLGTIGAGPVEDGITLIRTRGELLVQLVTASASGGGFFGAFGIGIVTAAAFSAGVASVPTPITEEGWDGWLYHRYLNVITSGIIDGSVAADHDFILSQGGVFRVEVDSKAMRKHTVDDVVFCCMEVTEGGTSTGRWLFNSRLLAKLP